MNFRQYYLKEMSAYTKTVVPPWGTLNFDYFNKTKNTIPDYFELMSENSNYLFMDFTNSKNKLIITGLKKPSENFQFVFTGNVGLDKIIENKNTIQEDTIATEQKSTGNKFTETLYRILLNSGNLLLCDFVHSEITKTIWEKLSREFESAIFYTDTKEIKMVDNFKDVDFDNKYVEFESDDDYYNLDPEQKSKIDNVRLIMWKK